MFDKNLIQDFYQHISASVNLTAHKIPNQSIPEIGAGTNGATGPILNLLALGNELDEHMNPRYNQYVDPDISPSFFQGVRERFGHHADQLLFQTLDIDNDPLHQGLEGGKYDLVVLAVLHGTKDIDVTLSHTRKILIPGGKLFLLEPCSLDYSRVSFVFGLLPGGWVSTGSYRRLGSLLSNEQWHQALEKYRSAGSATCVLDYAGERHIFSVITSTAGNMASSSAIASRFAIVTASESLVQHELARQIQDQLRSSMPTSSCGLNRRESKEKPHTSKKHSSMFLPKIGASLLLYIQAEDFARRKYIVSVSKKRYCGLLEQLPDKTLGLKYIYWVYDTTRAWRQHRDHKRRRPGLLPDRRRPPSKRTSAVMGALFPSFLTA